MLKAFFALVLLIGAGGFVVSDIKAIRAEADEEWKKERAAEYDEIAKKQAACRSLGGHPLRVSHDWLCVRDGKIVEF